MEPSQDCFNIIKEFEGFRENAYPDPATGGEPITIGYGLTAVVLGRPVSLGDRITQEQAENDLEMVVNKVAKYVDNLLTNDMITSQGQFDAMVSLTYNIGIGNFKNSTVLKENNVGNLLAAADAFLLWNKAAGHVVSGLDRRRKEERSLYLS